MLMNFFEVHIFCGGHKILRNLHQLFVLCTASQIFTGDFAKFWAFSEYMNFNFNEKSRENVGM